MARRQKATEQPRKPRSRKKTTKRKPTKGADGLPVNSSRGGYAHKAPGSSTYIDPEGRNEDFKIPKLSDLEGLDLSGSYPPGEVPEVVMYGRRMQALTLMVQGAPPFQIKQYLMGELGLSATQCRHIMADIRKMWREEMNELLVDARAEAINRIRRDLSMMRSPMSDGRNADVDWNAINRHEKLLAQLEGTLAPVKVSVVDLNEVRRSAVAGIVGTMSEEEMETFVTEGYSSEVSETKRLTG